jgi:osmotically-inducible protein OsmY
MELRSFGLPAALLAASLFGACQNTGRGIQEDTQKNTAAAREAGRDAGNKADEMGRDARSAAGTAGDATRDAADRTGDAARDAAHRTGDAASDAAHRTGDAASDAAHRAGDATRDASSSAAANTKDAANSLGSKIDAATQTMDVKTALMSDKTVDASGIDVDTNADTKTVTLKGHVKTAAEKARAAQIAKSKADGYRVVNNLTISAH